MQNIISLGAGVQSSTMALMAERGEIEPMPLCAIFADTQAEPASVYTWLDWLEKKLSFPIFRITKGDLGKDAVRLIRSKHGTYYTKPSLPAFMKGGGLAPRQCTSDYKIVIIQRKIREIIGKGGLCVQWLGISTNEADRCKPSRKKYITNRYPLIEKAMNRQDCLKWMREKGYPEPPRSACYFCAFHSDAEWLKLKRDEPESFKKAVEFEKEYQQTLAQTTSMKSVPFLHRSHQPLDMVPFGQEKDLFSNDCEGYCGV